MASKKNKPAVGESTALVVVPVVERTRDDLVKDIVSLITADGSFDITVHNIAVECLTHAATFGDYTLFAQLVGNCKTAGGVVFGKGVQSRRLALLEWAAKFSPIRVNGDGVMGQLPTTAKTYTEYNVEAATAEPFYELASEKNRREKNNPFDVATILARVGSFTKAIDKAVENGDLNDDETALRVLATEINAFAARRARELGLNSDEAKARRAA